MDTKDIVDMPNNEKRKKYDEIEISTYNLICNLYHSTDFSPFNCNSPAVPSYISDAKKAYHDIDIKLKEMEKYEGEYNISLIKRIRGFMEDLKYSGIDTIEDFKKRDSYWSDARRCVFKQSLIEMINWFSYEYGGGMSDKKKRVKYQGYSYVDNEVIYEHRHM